MTTCDRCGYRNEESARFCTSCGQYLEWVAQTKADDVPGNAATSADNAQPEPPTSTKEPEPSESKPAPPVADQVTDANAAAGPSPYEQAMSVVHEGQRLALARDRPDLAQHLESTQSKLTDQTFPVAVVGEFKRGKSTLVNALLQTAVCPVDADIVTGVPTLVRYGEKPQAIAYREPRGEEDDLLGEVIPLDRLGEFVSETGNPGNRRRLRSVEVQLKHRLLRSGLALVDTPGVGGLDSAHGVITLSALDLADAMLFVTDASQELTAPEIAFLRLAIERCSLAACVISKTDLYPDWRRIAAINEGHLRRAGVDLTVIPVSSFLRLRSARDPAVGEESGFRPLIKFLAARVVADGNARSARAAARDVAFVTGQLGRQVEAERQVVARPNEAARVVSQLTTASARTERLSSPTANWQQTLADGIQDLVADIEYDLQNRIREVSREVDVVIDQGDPKDTWADIDVWLRRHVVSAAVANYDEMSRRAAELATEVAGRFDLEASTPVALALSAPSEALGSIGFASLESVADRPGRFGATMMAARSTAFVPMLMFSVAGNLLGVFAGPLGVVLGAGIGRKVIKDERARQVAYRRQQAKAAARRFLDEATFVVGKDCRDTLRRTQRTLRDEFQARAMAIHRSSVDALASVEEARDLRPKDRADRKIALTHEVAELRALQQQLAAISAPPRARVSANA